MPAAEGLADQLADMGFGYVVDLYIAQPAHGQAAGHHAHSILRTAVNRAVDHHHAVGILGGIAAPLGILVQNIAQVFPPDGAVQRADHLDIHRGCLGQHRLYLGAILAHNVAEVAPRIGNPLGFKIHLVGEKVAVQRAEAAEAVRGKQHLVRRVVGHHSLRPVYHGRHDEHQLVPPGGKLGAFLHRIAMLHRIKAEELGDQRRGSPGKQQLDLRIAVKHLGDGGAVVRLHMVDDKIVQLAAVQGAGQVLKELG